MSKGKKVLATLLVIALAFALVACTSKEEDDSLSARKKTSVDVTKAPEDDDKEKLPENGDDDNDDDGAFAGDYKLNTSYTIEETCLYDEKDVKIKATELRYEDGNAVLHLELENNTEGTISLSLGNNFMSAMTVNHYMVYFYYDIDDVESGNTGGGDIYIFGSELQRLGIKGIADISFNAAIANEEYYEFYTPTLVVETTLADSYDYTTDTYLEALRTNKIPAECGYTVDYHNTDVKDFGDGISVISSALFRDDENEVYLAVELQNEGDEMVYGDVRDVKINNLVLAESLTSASSLLPGTRSVLMLSVSLAIENDFWENFGIVSIEQVDFSVEISNTEAQMISETDLSLRSADTVAPVDTTGEVVYRDETTEIIYKGTKASPSEESDSTVLMLLAHNVSGTTYTFDACRRGALVNGSEASIYTENHVIAPDEYALVLIEIYESTLEGVDVERLDGIKNIVLSAAYCEVDDYEWKDMNIDIIY